MSDTSSSAQYPHSSQSGSQPNSYLAWAILSTLFCCVPFGVASIVYAAQVGSKYNAGDYAGAFESSANARKWATVSTVLGLVIIIVSGISYSANLA